MTSGFSFHFLIEQAVQRHRQGTGLNPGSNGVCWQTPITVPDGTSRLTRGPDHEVNLSPCSRKNASDGVACLPLSAARPPGLLVVSSMGRGLTVNGRPVPSIVLLKEQDELAVERWTGLIGHLVAYHSRLTGRIPAGSIDSICPLCKARFSAGTTVYECMNCGAYLHMEGDEKDVSNRLTCAAMTERCPVCASRVQMGPGYGHLPGHYVKGRPHA